jgi:hypothetical protein
VTMVDDDVDMAADMADEVLSQLRACAASMARAKDAYVKAMYDAREARIPNTRIAAEVGISEAGVRMFFKRRGA